MDRSGTGEARAMEPGVAVRAEVLEQHRALRARLERLHREAVAVLDGAAASALRDEVIQLGDELVAHLAYEESALLPLLVEAAVGGPGRVERLRADHHRQRAQLRAFVAACGGEQWTERSFAAQTRLFSVDLLEDMAVEEAMLLGDELFSDEDHAAGRRPR
jgi:hypothetical protein